METLFLRNGLLFVSNEALKATRVIFLGRAWLETPEERAVDLPLKSLAGVKESDSSGIPVREIWFNGTSLADVDLVPTSVIDLLGKYHVPQGPVIYNPWGCPIFGSKIVEFGMMGAII